jgi:hypothetical protein
MTKENRLWVTRLKCAMPNSQKALKRGSAKAQTLWCIAEALQKHSGAVLNLRGLKEGVERSRELMTACNPSAKANKDKNSNAPS